MAEIATLTIVAPGDPDDAHRLLECLRTKIVRWDVSVHEPEGSSVDVSTPSIDGSLHDLLDEQLDQCADDLGITNPDGTPVGRAHVASKWSRSSSPPPKPSKNESNRAASSRSAEARSSSRSPTAQNASVSNRSASPTGTAASGGLSTTQPPRRPSGPAGASIATTAVVERPTDQTGIYHP